ncbi:hypothetical protein [Candidatus Phycosocius spiralis]|uniref:Uncharacterized protein n=1 Tax=Candidatus Phycosocius spiralis TaxID=2815099 RepID=A0ABQ4PTT1_9PROT|nr:hypothetical protein [Candidatus Phycosocius spiralis]GIU66335.1 hypothetical protein PsB1_0489 [Candidatus Phycosocius spiralis]
MKIDPTPFMQSGALAQALAKSRMEANEARKAFDSLLGNANQRPVMYPPPAMASAQREPKAVETRIAQRQEPEKDEEPTPSPEPMQRSGRVLDIRV